MSDVEDGFSQGYEVAILRSDKVIARLEDRIKELEDESEELVYAKARIASQAVEIDRLREAVKFAHDHSDVRLNKNWALLQEQENGNGQ
jgi:microcompartment protein CcmL/EutN